MQVRYRVTAAAGQRDDVIPLVTGAGAAGFAGRWARCSRWNSRVTSRDRYSLAERRVGLKASATAIVTATTNTFGAARIMPSGPSPDHGGWAAGSSWPAMNSRLPSFRAKSALV